VKAKINPSLISGTLVAPTSKSSMQRACAASILKAGHTWIKNAGNSNDDKAALQLVKDLGAVSVDYLDDGGIVIISDGVQCENSEVNCGESGLSIRMFIPIIALSNNEVTINGSGSLLSRPMNFFDEVLPSLEVKIKSNNGKVPIVLKGPLQPKDITIDGSLSSQYLTGMLMAYSAADAKAVTIKVNDLKSIPYIDLTLSVMKAFGMKMPMNKDYKEFYFEEKTHVYPFTYQEYTVEGDWSGGAFLLVAGAIAGKLVIKGLDPFSTQADKAILQAIIASGATISIEEKRIEIAPPITGLSALKPFHFNATDCPDLFPPLVALASYCNGTSVIEGVSRLAHKESNRGLTLQEEFAKMGVEIILQDDLMMVKGGAGLKGAVVHSRHDHRIAMACAVAALKASGATIIEEAEAINKSYPNFYEHLQLLNADVSLIN
jgi:3-phosphoshikimate 1-carboxyvinyltransferase